MEGAHQGAHRYFCKYPLIANQLILRHILIPLIY